MSTLKSPSESFTYHCFARPNGLCSGHERVECISGGGCIDRAGGKTGVGINDILRARVATRKRPTYPTIPAPQCFAILQKNQMATVVVWFNNRPTKKTNILFLLTLLIVCDLDGELFPGLQARVEPGGVRTRRGQRHAGARERTLRDGVSDGRPAMIWRA
jgi:hypothetical protein